MTRLRLFFSIITLVLVLPVSCQSKDTDKSVSAPRSTGEMVEIRPRLQPGDVFSMEFATQQNVIQTFGGQETSMLANIAMGMTLSAVEVEGEDTGVKITYDWSTFKQEHPKFKVDFDSRKSDSVVHPMARGFAAIVGEGFVLVLDSSGQPKAVRGVDELLKNVTAKLKLEEMPEEKANKIRQALEQHFNEKGLLSTFRQTFGFYPGRPLGIGDSWERTFDMTQNSSMTIANKWTLVDTKNNIAEIDVASKINSDESGDAEAAVTQDVSGTQNGKMKIDLATGMPITATLTQDLAGTVSIKPTEQMPKTMSVPISMDSKVTIAVTKTASGANQS